SAQAREASARAAKRPREPRSVRADAESFDRAAYLPREPRIFHAGREASERAAKRPRGARIFRTKPQTSRQAGLRDRVLGFVEQSLDGPPRAASLASEAARGRWSRVFFAGARSNVYAEASRGKNRPLSIERGASGKKAASLASDAAPRRTLSPIIRK